MIIHTLTVKMSHMVCTVLHLLSCGEKNKLSVVCVIIKYIQAVTNKEAVAVGLHTALGIF